MVLYRITPLPLAEELQSADVEILTSFYVDDAAFDGSAQRSAHLLNMLMEKGRTRGIYPSQPSRYLSQTRQTRRKR